MLIGLKSWVWFQMPNWQPGEKQLPGTEGAVLTPRGGGTQSLMSWHSQLECRSACLKKYIRVYTPTMFVCLCAGVCFEVFEASVDSKQHPDLS